MSQRNGFSLIEMILTMSVGSVLMLLAMTLLQQAMSLSSQAHDQLDESRSANRLCDQFRRDAHAASELNIDSDVTVTFALDDGRAVYSVRDGQVTREQFGSASTPTKRTHREVYELGDSSELSIQKLKKPERASLTIRHRTPLKHLESKVDRQIAAVIGRLRIDTPTNEVQP